MKRILLLLTLLMFSPLLGEEKNEVIVCDNGLEMFSYSLDFIANAKQSIEISSPFVGGKIIRDLFSALDRRIEEVPQLQVHMLIGALMLEERDWKMLKDLCNKYPENFHLVMSREIPQLFPQIIKYNNHVKLIVVDEHYFEVGGTNLDEGLCTEGTHVVARKPKGNLGPLVLPGAARDGDVVGKGPVAKEIRQFFYKLYALWKEYGETFDYQGDPEAFAAVSEYWVLDETLEKPFAQSFETAPDLVTTNTIHLFYGAPAQKINLVRQEYQRLISSARQEITIGNLHFFPQKDLLQSMIDAVNRGIRLNLITNGIHPGVTPVSNESYCWSSRLNYVPIFYGRHFDLLESADAAILYPKKTNVFEYYCQDVVYHKKSMLVDDRYLVVGSYNFGLKSDEADFELVLVIDSPEAAFKARRVFKKDMSHSIRIAPYEARLWYFDPVIVYLAGLQKSFQNLI